MPKFLSLFSFFFSISFFLVTTPMESQQSPLAELVEYSATRFVQQEYKAFTISNSFMEYEQTKEFVSSATILDVNFQMIHSIVKDKPAFISFSIPQKDGPTIVLDLVEKSPLNEDFTLVENTHPNVSIPYNEGAYYRGIIHGDPGSVAAISFFNNNIIGIISNEQEGNMVLGKVDAEANATESTSDQLIYYHEKDMLEQNPFQCKNDFLPDTDIYRDIEDITAAQYAESCKTVSVYIEGDNLLYRDKSSSKTATTNYITGLFNAVSTLYEKEEITTDIKKILIWTTNDPYSRTSAPLALREFSKRNKDNFDGDIGHLFSRSRNNLGGLAWVDVLCRRFSSSNNFGRFAFSNISNSFTKYPTFSWTTMVVTHEMGHNLGSPHTHRCAWGPSRNQALDNCVATEGGCAPGPTPAGGGTIMSYCHLSRHGINFRRGFGQEPGDLIRSKVTNARCLGSSFEAKVTPNTNQEVYFGDSVQLRATPTGFKYSYQWYKDNVAISGKTDKNIVIKSRGDYYAEVTTNCSVISNNVVITNKEFIASINFPSITGTRDSISFNVNDTIDSQEELIMTLDIPADVLKNLSNNLLTYFVRLTTDMKGGFPTELLLLEIGVNGPPSSGIDLPNYNPSKDENKFRKNKIYSINLGEINPSGTWEFIIKNNNTVDKTKPISLNFKLELVSIEQGSSSLENMTVCDVKDLVLDPNLGNSDYKWSNGETTETITINSPGTYSVTVTNGSLISEDEIIISEPQKVFEQADTICANEFFVFGQQSLTTTGIYIEKFTSPLGCDSTITLTLTVLDENLTTKDSTICYGDKFEGKPYFANEIVNNSLTAINGCDSVIRTTLTVIPEILIDYFIDTACQNIGSSINISSSNGDNYSYTWEDGSTVTQRDHIKAETLIVEVKNDQNCLISMEIDIPSFDSIDMAVTIQDVICFEQNNGEIQLSINSGTSPFDYLWTDGSVIDSRTGLSPNHYTVDILDKNQCKWHGEFDINTPEELNATFNINMVSSSSSKFGEIEIKPTGGISPYTYLWEDGNTWRWRKNLTPGTYKIIITDANGCTKEFSQEILITAINSIPDLSLFELFPNPTTKFINVNVTLKNVQDYTVSLISSNGHTLKSKNYSQNNGIFEKWDLNTLSSGVYFVKLSTTKGTSIKKIIIAKN